MELLENYLAAVRRNLPAKEAGDITAELRDVLLAKAEEQEERTGSIDWTQLLRDFGHPVAVAARYRNQRWLIGPELYPFYLHFLRIIVGIVLAVLVGIAAFKGVLWANDPGRFVTEVLGSLWSGVVSTVGSVTIMFVLLERFGGGMSHYTRHWTPAELPNVVDRQPSVYASIFEVSAGALFLLWWLGAIPTPQLTNGQFRLDTAEIWDTHYWPVAALLAGRLVYSIVGWLRPRWKNVRWLLGAVTTVGGIAVAALVYRSGEWMRVVPTGMTAEQAQGLQTSLNMALNIAIIVIVIIWTLGVLGELWRLSRGLREGTPATA